MKKIASLLLLVGVAGSTLGGCYVRETRRGGGYHHHDGYARGPHRSTTTVVVRP